MRVTHGHPPRLRNTENESSRADSQPFKKPLPCVTHKNETRGEHFFAKMTTNLSIVAKVACVEVPRRHNQKIVWPSCTSTYFTETNGSSSEDRSRTGSRTMALLPAAPASGRNLEERAQHHAVPAMDAVQKLYSATQPAPHTAQLHVSLPTERRMPTTKRDDSSHLLGVWKSRGSMEQVGHAVDTAAAHPVSFRRAQTGGDAKHRDTHGAASGTSGGKGTARAVRPPGR